MVPVSHFYLQILIMSNDINKQYEARHLADIQKYQKQIELLYRKVIANIYKEATNLKPKGNTFSITDFPDFNKKVDKILLQFTKDVDLTLVNGVKGQWELSTEKNGAVIHQHYGSSKISDKVNKIIYNPNTAALEHFISQKTAGLNLSDRVLKYTSQLQGQIEQNLFAGISEGKSAVAMARDQVSYMQNPEPLFRRVKYITDNGKAKLRLSKPAQKYYSELGAPGQGVYRSPFKNFMRITRTVTNDGYRQADMVRYKTLPFVLGYQVNLSNNHPKVDICDSLQGVYPKWFLWLKWHVHCLCYCIAKLATPEEYDRYEQAILDGTDKNFKFKDVINTLPVNFVSYVNDNAGKMDNWKRKPEWVTNNEIKI